MKAAVLYAPGQPVQIEDIVIDNPGPGEVLIRVVASGVCHSDLHVCEGTLPSGLPVALGHEAAGVVEAVGQGVVSVKPGDHVVTCISGFCGACEDCLSGHMAICRFKGVDRPRGSPPRLASREGRKIHQMTGINGFSEYMLVSARTCAVIPPDMPLHLACVLGCAVTTGYGAVVHTARVEPGSTVAVLGCGGVGLMAVNAARLAGAGQIIAIDLVPGKLDLARAMGATATVDASVGDPVEAVRELTRGGVHYSFEAIGLKTTIEQAFRMLRHGGTATMVGAAPFGTKLEVDAFELLMERKLQGSYMGSNRFPIDIPRLVDFYLQGRLDLERLVARRVGLDQVNQALAALKTGEAARTVIEFAG